MARRLVSTPKDPEAVGLAVLALRNFVQPVASPTDFEAKTAAHLQKLRISKTTARRMLSHFDGISRAHREQYLGKIGTTTKMLRRTVKKRDPNAITVEHVAIPQFTLQRRLPRIPGTIIDESLGPNVLAPIDYTITYEGMHCYDETGWDRLGSDEVYVVTSAAHVTPQADNAVRTERHPIQAGQSGVYGDVDSDETRVGPRAACWQGVVANVSAGMSLTTVFFEHDYGDPDEFRDEVDAAVKLAIAIATYLYPPAGAILALIEASGLLTDFFNWLLGTGDDEIGTTTQVFELSDLEDFSRSRTINLTIPPGSGGTQRGLIYHFLASVNDKDYIAGYQVRRNPPAPLYPDGPVD